ncbi:MAG: hypothetical protein RLZZ172_1551 [Bacteroidota bacterium]|jgi:hypothetical protein
MQVNDKEIKKINLNLLIVCLLCLQIFLPFQH